MLIEEEHTKRDRIISITCFVLVGLIFTILLAVGFIKFHSLPNRMTAPQPTYNLPEVYAVPIETVVNNYNTTQLVTTLTPQITISPKIVGKIIQESDCWETLKCEYTGRTYCIKEYELIGQLNESIYLANIIFTIKGDLVLHRSKQKAYIDVTKQEVIKCQNI